MNSALEPQQDKETRQFEIQGSATAMPGLIPNKGDMFLADIGDGQQGLFTVTDTQKLTHLKESLYSIDFTLIDYAGKDSDRVKDLEEKTVQDFTFVRDYLTVGERPLITTNEFSLRQDMIQLRRELAQRYMGDFFSREKSLLLIPGQGQRTYDPFLQSFVRDVIGGDEHPFINQLVFPPVAGVPGMDQETLWDAIRKMSSVVLTGVVRAMGIVPVVYWRGQPHYAGLAFSGASQVTYPADFRADVDADWDGYRAPVSDATLVAGQVRRNDIQGFMESLGRAAGFEMTCETVEQLPYAVPVTADEAYVFTRAFYRGTGPYSSHLERLTHLLLRNEPLEKPLLYKIASESLHWPNLERFYYTPVILALLQVAIQTS